MAAEWLERLRLQNAELTIEVNQAAERYFLLL